MNPTFSFSDVDALRKQSRQLAGSIAPVVSSNQFKSPRCFQKPSSKCFSHRLNIESKSRGAATLKAGGAELKSDIISLATGRPSPAYFPLNGMSLEFPRGPDYFDDTPCNISSVHIGKYDLKNGMSNFDIATCLNYGYSAGSEQLLRFLTEHVDVVHNPPYSNWEVALNVGSTSALDAALRMFCSRGDHILMEEYSYSGAIETAGPLGIQTVGIKMDEQGLLPDDLNKVLTDWDSNKRNSPKPFLLYMIPTGHNPTGFTQPLERRRNIYAVAEKHDLYIIEDDPYYFLRLQGRETPPARTLPLAGAHTATTATEFLESLIPSYLSLDTSGRVLRLDSTSKTLAPGLRCSYMTANADIISQLLYHHDVSVVSPSGLSQLVMHTLLDEVWGHRGYIEWLMSLCTSYAVRRDAIISACEKYLPRSLASWTTPEYGMFLWIKIQWSEFPLAKYVSKDSKLGAISHIEEAIYSGGLRNGVMCCKGSMFRVDRTQDQELFFRATFATASLSDLDEAIKRLGEAIDQIYSEEDTKLSLDI